MTAFTRPSIQTALLKTSTSAATLSVAKYGDGDTWEFTDPNTGFKYKVERGDHRGAFRLLTLLFALV